MKSVFPEMSWTRWIFLLGLLALIAACVTQPQRITGVTQVHAASELHNWTASGRIGVTGVESGGSGGFTWNQQTDVSNLQLRGPVGVGSLAIHMQGKQLSMQASDGTQYDAERALAELEVRLGAPVPIAQLRYWLLGLAAPGEHRWSDASSSVLEQDGWRINYSDWLQRDALRLPGKVTLTRESLRIVIAVQAWRLEA